MFHTPRALCTIRNYVKNSTQKYHFRPYILLHVVPYTPCKERKRLKCHGATKDKHTWRPCIKPGTQQTHKHRQKQAQLTKVDQCSQRWHTFLTSTTTGIPWSPPQISNQGFHTFNEHKFYGCCHISTRLWASNLPKLFIFVRIFVSMFCSLYFLFNKSTSSYLEFLSSTIYVYTQSTTKWPLFIKTFTSQSCNTKSQPPNNTSTTRTP